MCGKLNNYSLSDFIGVSTLIISFCQDTLKTGMRSRISHTELKKLMQELPITRTS